MKRQFVLALGIVSIFYNSFLPIKVFGQERSFMNTMLTLEERVDLLIGELTTEEKISLFGYDHKGIERLGIMPYNWWNEALHGVARAGSATVYPQAIGLAATFNDSLVNKVAEAISVEARAKYNLSLDIGRHQQYLGLTFWSPNINIFRDPRWGRGQETYGEDPYLTSQIGISFVNGLQGDDKNYLRAAAGAKHFAVHSGPEADRHTFNAIVSNKDLRETYLYAFQKLISDTDVEAVMCAYNRVNDEPCCTGKTLINDILREEWNFQGHIVTDCWALEDVWLRHKVEENSVNTAAKAIKAGVNLDCSDLLQTDLQSALDNHLITEKELDVALRPTLRTWFKLGFFDNPEDVPFSSLGAQDVRTELHIDLARESAIQSMVLLKNDNNLLPLNKSDYSTMLITGTNAASADALLANYHGVSPNMVTFMEGITEAAGPETAVQYDMGCDYIDTTRFGAVWVSKESDITIVVIGMTSAYEGEGGDAFLAPKGGDKKDLSLPPGHIAFMKELRKSHDKPIVAVITGGGAMDIKAIESYADAIIMSWYPGEQGGNAFADVLFGKAVPSGRLPVTFYNSTEDLPPYDEYSMQGRTYRYFDGEVAFPFGFGLSYTTFQYQWNQKPANRYSEKDTISFSIDIKNIGEYSANEVAQVYVTYPGEDAVPLKELKDYINTYVTKDSKKKVIFQIPVKELEKWDSKKDKWKIIKGEYQLYVGSHSLDKRLATTFKIG